MSAAKRTQCPQVTVGRPGACNYTDLRKATRHLGQLCDDIMEPSGLRAAQHGILAYVEALEKPTMKRLAGMLVMDLSALGHTLKPLVRDGFVDLVPDPDDGRAKRVVLTPRGRAKLAETRRLWATAQSRIETALGAEKAQQLREMLTTVSSKEFGEAFRVGKALPRTARARVAARAASPPRGQRHRPAAPEPRLVAIDQAEH